MKNQMFVSAVRFFALVSIVSLLASCGTTVSGVPTPEVNPPVKPPVTGNQTSIEGIYANSPAIADANCKGVNWNYVPLNSFSDAKVLLTTAYDGKPIPSLAAQVTACVTFGNNMSQTIYAETLNGEVYRTFGVYDNTKNGNTAFKGFAILKDSVMYLGKKPVYFGGNVFKSKVGSDIEEFAFAGFQVANSIAEVKFQIGLWSKPQIPADPTWDRLPMTPQIYIVKIVDDMGGFNTIPYKSMFAVGEASLKSDPTKKFYILLSH
jgi:hypothetical protein